MHQYYNLKTEVENLRMNGRIQEAKQMAGQALQQISEAPEMLITYASLADPIEEQDTLNDFIKQKPYMWELKIQLGLSYLKDQDLENAEKTLLEAMEICGGNGMVYNNLAQICYHRRDYLGAIKWLRENLRMEPYNMGAFEMMVNTLMLI